MKLPNVFVHLIMINNCVKIIKLQSAKKSTLKKLRFMSGWPNMTAGHFHCQISIQHDIAVICNWIVIIIKPLVIFGWYPHAWLFWSERAGNWAIEHLHYNNRQWCACGNTVARLRSAKLLIVMSVGTGTFRCTKLQSHVWYCDTSVCVCVCVCVCPRCGSLQLGRAAHTAMPISRAIRVYFYSSK